MRYFCHHCHTHISADELLPEFTCPSCHSGFVEEIPVQAARRASLPDESGRTGSDPEIPGFISTRMSSDEYSDDNSDVELLDAVQGPLAQVFGLFQPQPQSSTSGPIAPGQSPQQSETNPSVENTHAQTNRVITRPTARRTAQMHFDSSQSLSDVLNDFIAGVSFGAQYASGTSSSAQGASGSGPSAANRGLINIDFPLPFLLHSNPGDYAWGNAGFDAVITQLLNNLDGSNSGPPPMPKDQVDNLPTVKISDEQVKSNNLQCTVCMDDFQVGDCARQLPCEHFFHQDCILPWLNIHASCPICRKTFVTGTTATQNPSSDPSTESTNRTTTATPLQRPTNSEQASVGELINSNRNATSSTTVTNQNVAPNYDYTEDDCD